MKSYAYAWDMEQTSEGYANILKRLRDKTEELLAAYDAIEPPKTFIEVERAAKVLIAVAKAAASPVIVYGDDLDDPP